MWIRVLWFSSVGVGGAEARHTAGYEPAGSGALGGRGSLCRSRACAGCDTRAEWVKANKYRKYFRVVMVAVIESGDGRTIDDRVLKGIVQHDRVRKIEWAVQGRPKKTDWRVCRKVLKLSLLNYKCVLA